MYVYDWNMTLNLVKRVIYVVPSTKIEGSDIFEIESCNCIFLVWMMDLGVGWLEQHEIILTKVMKLS